MKQLFLFAAILLAFTSCRQRHGSGNVITEKKQVDNFKGIDAGSAFEVELKNGPVASVEIQADDNLMKLVEVEVSGGVLRIHTKGSYSFSDSHFKAFITAPEINSVKATGAANINVLDVLKNNGKISFESSGAAHIRAEVDTPEVDADASGAADLKLAGKTRDYHAESSGAANIKSKELLSENAVANASGAGNIHVYASVSLKAEASGAGNVYYSGGASVEPKSSGAGNVKKED